MEANCIVCGELYGSGRGWRVRNFRDEHRFPAMPTLAASAPVIMVFACTRNARTREIPRSSTMQRNRFYRRKPNESAGFREGFVNGRLPGIWTATPARERASVSLRCLRRVSSRKAPSFFTTLTISHKCRTSLRNFTQFCAWVAEIGFQTRLKFLVLRSFADFF